MIMETIFYLLKMNLAIIVLGIIYKAFFCRDTFFSMRRYMLVSILLFSILYPFIDLSHLMTDNGVMRDIVLSYINILPEDITANAAVSSNENPTITFYGVLFHIYFAVVCFFLLGILFSLMRIMWLRLHSESVMMGESRVSILNVNDAPFSFFSYIFINPDMYDEKEIHEIMAHEMVHVRQRHSIDVIFSEIVCAFCWINPLAWIVKREIQKNLEFLVDESVVSQDGIDMKSYQYHLLKLSYHPSEMALVNRFNISPLKERIIMINIKKSPRKKLMAYIFVLPVLFMFLAVNNISALAGRISIETNVVKEDMYVHMDVEEKPQFPGGDKAMVDYISKNCVYPITAMEKDVDGIVIVEFTVNTDGSVSDVKVHKGFDEDCDNEAVRLVKSFPDFKPGKQRGQNVRVRCTVPVRFRLQK